MSSSQPTPIDRARPAREQLQLLADISSAAVAYLDREHCFEITNQAFNRRFGTPAPRAAARHVLDEVCSPAVDEYLTKAMAHGQALSAQLDCTGQHGGTDRLRLQVVPYLNADRVEGAFVILDDLESRPVTAPDDPEHDERLVNMQRMAKLGEMAAGLAHEIRQPLAAIRNYAHALTRFIEAGRPGEDTLPLVTHITQQTERADRYIAYARNMIGQGRDHFRRIDIARVVDDSLGLIERRARLLDVNVRLALASRLPPVEGNPSQIEQILVNLMTNALDAMDGCGLRELQIDVSAIGRQAIRLRIEDSGRGIPDSRLSTIFNAFDSGKDEGMGMGLSISRALAERHGGQLWAETDRPAGAAFVLELPAANDGHEQDTDHAEQGGPEAAPPAAGGH